MALSRIIGAGTLGADLAHAEPFGFAPLVALVPTPDPDPFDDALPDEAALEAAFCEGVAAGRAERDDEVEALRADAQRHEAAHVAARDAEAATATLVADSAARLEAAWREAVSAREPDLVALALDVVEAVLAAPPSSEQRIATATAISQAIDSLAGSTSLTVALHPVDLLHLQEAGLAEPIAATHTSLRWEPDAALAEGDWTVTTPEAAVHRLRAPMLAAVRERLGLPLAL